MSIERFSEFKSIDAAYKHSADVINSLRKDLESALSGSDFKDRLTIVTTGSFGRGEASAESDLDLFIFFDSDKSEDSLYEEKKSIQGVVDKYIKKSAGDTGTFGSEAVVNFSEMLQNLGGDKDLNVLLTRRMLFLLEGKWLYGEERFKSYRTDLLNKYIKAGDPEKQISRFLLNDIIRYYRTIATDFEFKVSENSKSWGLRNVKLRFSRKLLYFGGVISVAETAFVAQANKNQLIADILDKTVLERVQDLGAENAHTTEILNIYQDFLATIECPKNREILEGVTKGNRTDSKLFLQMREKSKEFSKVLDNWLKLQYPDGESGPHPIHNALIF
ncbi:nucleotidyltransferase family protein [Pseudomonas asplenii]|uniref:Nucleotidyltransferase family protein n=1 Tax=Pseudomonas asplenii TaxID=53407 RepID=A0A0N0VKQ4_9PSED|nr:nucleotidyltransferase domain-containing protein [Pseudomonas fuscovaginae]KPA92325.1 nucleotidyltransferase family protein [Pseudomonas fuscovaginae]